MKLKKGVYGLRQSSRSLLDIIDDSLKDMGFTATKSDPSVCIFDSDGNLQRSADDPLSLGGDTPLLMDRIAKTGMEDVSMVLAMHMPKDRSRILTTSEGALYQVNSGTIRLCRVKTRTYDGNWSGVISQSAGHDASRLYGHPTSPGRHGVARIPEPILAL